MIRDYQTGYNVTDSRVVHEPTYDHQLYASDPKFLVLDVNWLDDHVQSEFWFFQRYPLRQLLQTVTSVSTYEDYEPALWTHIEAVFDDDELQTYDFGLISIVIERLIEMFYQWLNGVAPRLDASYVFMHWVDRNTIVLVREDVASHYHRYDMPRYELL